MPPMMLYKIVLAGPHSSCETSQSETSQSETSQELLGHLRCPGPSWTLCPEGTRVELGISAPPTKDRALARSQSAAWVRPRPRAAG